MEAASAGGPGRKGTIMIGLGTLINTAAVVAGGLLGITVKKGIPERCREVLMQACGVSTIFIGAGGVMAKMLTFTDGKLETQGTLLLIFSMIIGSLIGSLLDIEQRMEKLGEFLKKNFTRRTIPTSLKALSRQHLLSASEPWPSSAQLRMASPAIFQH